MGRAFAAWPHAVVAFESPQRLPKTLASLAAGLPARQVAVCRELTKAFEEVVRGLPADVLERFREPPKGEITLVLAPADASSSSDEHAVEAAAAAVAELVAAGLTRRDAAELVSRLTSIPRGRLYRRSL